MITLIAARSRNSVIGVDGHLPWHLSEDLKRFKILTTNGTVIMGRKTFDSIGSALPDRQNIVLTRNAEFETAGVETAATLEDALLMSNSDNIFIIGGSEVYDEAIRHGVADRLMITLVDVYIDTDRHQDIAYFPKIDPEVWKVEYTQRLRDDLTDTNFAIVEYLRRSQDGEYTPLVYLPASRFDDQTEKMEQILQDGLCPFCPEWLDWYHDSSVVFETRYWVVTPNDNPYSGALIDLLLIPKEHVMSFELLTYESQKDFGVVIAKIINQYNLDFGALGMRFGQMWHTGGSVAHLHAQLKVGDVHNPEHRPIRFKMSSIKQENKPPTIK